MKNLTILKLCCLVLIFGAFWGCAERNNPLDPGGVNYSPQAKLDSVPDTVYVNSILDITAENIPFYLNLQLQSPEETVTKGDTLTILAEIIDKQGNFVRQFWPFIQVSFGGEHSYENFEFISVEELSDHYEIKTLISVSDLTHRQIINVDVNLDNIRLSSSLTFFQGSKKVTPSTVRVNMEYSSYNIDTGDQILIDLYVLDDANKLTDPGSLNDIQINRIIQGSNVWGTLNTSVSKVSTGHYTILITNFSVINPGITPFLVDGYVSIPNEYVSKIQWSAIIFSAEGQPKSTAPTNPGTLNLTQ